MFYSVENSMDNIIKEKISSTICRCEDFTLTVNAVNDAPILLQPYENLEILEDFGAATVVLSTVCDVVHPTCIL